MKIVFFNYLPLEYGGGLAKYYQETAVALKKRYPHLQVTLLTASDRTAKRLLKMYSLYFRDKRDGQRHVMSKASLKRQLHGVNYKQVETLRELKQELQSQTVIYTKNDLLELFLLRIIGYKQLPPVIIGYHTPIRYDYTPSLQAKLHNLLYQSRIYRFFISPGKQHHVLTDFDKSFLTHHVSGMVTKIVNPYVKPFQTKRRVLKQFAHPQGIKVLLWAGRLTEQKGVTDLLSLIDTLNNTSLAPKLLWRIAGTGDMSKAVRQATKRWHNVEYVGHVPTEAMSSFYASGDVFLLTSKWESLPYTYLEAVQNGLPVVLYDLHGLRDLANLHPRSFVVSTINEFADTILKICAKKTMKTRKTPTFLKDFQGSIIYPRFYNTFLKPYE